MHEAKSRGFHKLYLKTDLVGYYEKFGAIFIEWWKSLWTSALKFVEIKDGNFFKFKINLRP